MLFLDGLGFPHEADSAGLSSANRRPHRAHVCGDTGCFSSVFGQTNSAMARNTFTPSGIIATSQA